jgi:DNA-binding NarL/FixJ family response regulator
MSSGAIVLVGLSPLTAVGIGAALSDVVDAAQVEPTAGTDSALARAKRGDVSLMIVDPYLPTLGDGLRFLREVKRRGEAPYTLAFSDFRSRHDVMYCFLAGVDSFVSSGESPERMVSAVRSTLDGRREWLLGACEARRRENTGEWEELTPRELEILWMVRDARTNRQIASTLVISPNTVKNHVAAILRKLGVQRRSELFSGASAPAMAMPSIAPTPVGGR